MERVDVAVVGGGPAGASAARAAAEETADVVLFEKGVPREDRPDPGPDSTDAAGILDYWVDLMQLDPSMIPDGIVLRHLDRAEFIGPTDRVTIRNTGIPSSYPHFGFTYDRAAFDDWLLDRARTAGADYRVGNAVADVTSTLNGGHSHTVTLRDGTQVDAEHLILADGPGRTVTLPVLEQFLPDASRRLDPTNLNHIAYQEYRRFPPEVFEPTVLKFWWGHMPGHTAYPWVFPNDDTIARVGLTMPINLDLASVPNRNEYRLLEPADDRVPSGQEYVRRLLELAYPDYDIDDFPLVESRGKSQGTETYPISSTRPIDSPGTAGVAVTGGAMGATSAFHEGGGHVAVRTGIVAGTLAARGELDRYNDEWKRAIGDEVLRNVAMADLVADYAPADWDQAFRIANRLIEAGVEQGLSMLEGATAAGWSGLKLAAGYRRRKFKFRNGRYVQVPESAYTYEAVKSGA